uniref:Uncharacterized protein n=1 Tax=Vitis vinifera TaxID=29760 RepID=A5AWF0_VITVI|nr:hypothetical protein VITISV_040942 [Vitis vinifera]
MGDSHSNEIMWVEEAPHNSNGIAVTLVLSASVLYSREHIFAISQKPQHLQSYRARFSRDYVFDCSWSFSRKTIRTVVDDEDDGDFQMPDLRERIKGSSASVLNMFNGDLGLRRFSGGSCFNGIKGFIILPE